MSDTPYCGAMKTPKGRTEGTMKECVQAHQVRKYGLKKVDIRIIKKTGAKGPTRAKVLSRRTALRAQVKRLKDDLPYAKTDEKEKEMKKSIAEKKKELKELNKLFAEFQKKRKAKN